MADEAKSDNQAPVDAAVPTPARTGVITPAQVDIIAAAQDITKAAVGVDGGVSPGLGHYTEQRIRALMIAFSHQLTSEIDHIVSRISTGVKAEVHAAESIMARLIASIQSEGDQEIAHVKTDMHRLNEHFVVGMARVRDAIRNVIKWEKTNV